MPTWTVRRRTAPARSQISVLDGVDVGAGNLVGTFRFANELDVPCTFYGYPGAQLLDEGSQALPTQVRPGGGSMQSQPRPSRVIVPGGGSAIFRMHWEQVPVGAETTCPQAARLTVTPPDEYEPLFLTTTIRACGGGRLDMGAIQPAAGVFE